VAAKSERLSVIAGLKPRLHNRTRGLKLRLHKYTRGLKPRSHNSTGRLVAAGFSPAIAHTTIIG
jgi:hypothetical protein